MMLPQAPPEMWREIAERWLFGFDTLEIAREMHIRECAVYNSLPKALRRYPVP